MEFDVKKKLETNLIEISELIGNSIDLLEKDNEKKINEKIKEAKNEIEKTVNVNKSIVNSKVEELNVKQYNNSISTTSELTNLNKRIRNFEKFTKENELCVQNQISENLNKID